MADRGVPDAGRRSTYFPALDGMRALGVVMVMAFHFFAGRGHAIGGFLGVDVFFVISGYLITSILLGRLDRNPKLDFGRFYKDRLARLTPALGLLIVGVLVISVVVGSGARHDTVEGLPFAATYLMDFYLPLAPFHSQFTTGGLFIHTWSLAVEEQFYLVWPAALALLFHRLKRDHLALVALVGAVAITVARAGAVASGVSPFTAYYLPFLHGDGLLVGCALALWLSTRPTETSRSATIVRVGAAVGLIVILVEGVFVIQDASGMAWGIPLAVIGSAFLAWSAVRAPTPGVQRLLSSPPALWVGRRSYSLYLWHPPLFYLWQFKLGSHGAGVVVVADLVSAVVAAEVSYWVVETRFNRWRHRRYSMQVERAA